MGDYVFENCSALIIYCKTQSQPDEWRNSWNFDDRPVVWNVKEYIKYNDFDLAYTMYNTITIVNYSGQENNVIIPEEIGGKKVTKINDKAFKEKKITSISLPESINYIGNEAFEDCSSLTSINIPEWLYSIGNRAFSGCSSLRSIKIPDSVEKIGFDAFWGCSSLFISCEAISKPFYWADDWNPDDRPVVWGAEWSHQ